MGGMVIITTTVISASVITVTLTEFENFSIAQGQRNLTAQ
jgi:hypothetical protein